VGLDAYHVPELGARRRLKITLSLMGGPAAAAQLTERLATPLARYKQQRPRVVQQLQVTHALNPLLTPGCTTGGRHPRDCPGRKPAFLVFKRPARPCKIPIQNGFS
jgi:hypothetical protein